MDAVQKANSGHPGLPMGAADIATTLFTKHLKFDPKNPSWPDRDRFVLSAGHGSMLIYSLLYLTGYGGISLEDIKNFRQLGSPTAGHPEYGHIPGIETTTGPLGQGIGNAVGMAIAERKLADEFGSDIVDHNTYALVGDGCLMEGISQEAITLAGHLKLNKLIVLWDDNNISIDGAISVSDSTDQEARFRSCNWNTLRVDGHDPEAISQALEEAKKSDTPTLIACKTQIGYGSPKKAGTASAHGSPLGDDEIAATRKALGWTAAPFEIPSDILDAWRLAGLRSAKVRKDWEKRINEGDADIKCNFERRMNGELPGALAPALDAYKKALAEDKPKEATRKASQLVLEVINGAVPETIGGSADLTGSNNTKTSQTASITPDDFSGRYLHFGIREHGMAAAMNGIALHGGLIPYSGGFLIFSDYCRPSIRLAALMGIRVIHVFTHDSIGLGEDGPTHQPVEQMAALRTIPNLNMFRPADITETLECWKLALESETRPSGIALTRQALPALRTTYVEENLCAHGAYELAPESDAQVTIFASGSEVEIAMNAKALLDAKGHSTRVVSVPCMDLFNDQDDDYKVAVIGDSPIKVAIEAGVRQGWDQFIGPTGIFIGMNSFGASGPYKELYEHFGITPEATVSAVEAKLQ